MLTQVHHACCDGMGILCFLDNLLWMYHQMVSSGGSLPSRSQADSERLRVRGQFGMTIAGWLARLPKDLIASLAAIEYFAHRPVPIASPVSGSRQESSALIFPTFASHRLSKGETSQLRDASRRMGCTLNDMLLAALFKALHRWNEVRHPEGNRGVLRIMVPVNFRTSADTAMPAANVLSMVYLDRRPHRFRTLQSLVKSVHWEMNLSKQWRLGLTLILFLRLFRLLPGGMARLLPDDRCLATAVLSNLGDLSQVLTLPQRDGLMVAGPAVIEEIDILPPIRPWTAASFSVGSYAGQITVWFTATHTVFGVRMPTNYSWRSSGRSQRSATKAYKTQPAHRSEPGFPGRNSRDFC